MALCRLMVEDFITCSGRFGDPDRNGFTKGVKLYDDDNLKEGIDYAEGLWEIGYKIEPFYRYDLQGFILWARRKLKGG